jgi:hypothetical protein
MGLRDRLTFGAEVRATTATINRLCGKAPEKTHIFFDGHVSGIKNLVYNKAIDMALLYNATCYGDRETRLAALARLRDEAYNYQGLEMPYNTRRILIALMKETVKARGDLLRQRRYMAAFNHALSGRAYVVRTMLDELGLAEVPEAALRGTARAKGWDDHVYDNAGPGRKTPAQLVLDAYIKGLSRLTIVYEDFQELEPLAEAVEAGVLMGIEVTVALECLVLGKWNRRFHHVLLMNDCPSAAQLAPLIESPAFKRLQKTLQANYSEHDRIYAQLVRAFNECSLPLVNEGFVGTSGELPPLSVESLKEQAQRQRLYHVHLGQLLARRLERLRDIRVALRPEAEDLAALPVAELRRRFFDPVSEGILEQGDFVKAAKLYAAVAEVEAEFGKRRVGIVFSRPLDNDLGTCVDHLIANAESIDAIEIWNNRFRREGYADNARFLESLRLSLNRGDAEAVEKLLASGSIAGPLAGPLAGLTEAAVAAAAERYRKRNLEARIGSNSDGYNHLAPGMGFVLRSDIRNWRAILRSNRSAPIPLRMPGIILPLGKNRAASSGRKHDRPFELVLRWRDLNRTIRTGARIFGGAVLALAVGRLLAAISGFPFSFGLLTLAAFFGITYLRNFVVDEIARHGLHPSRWRLKSFDKTNAANSVFFTFLSIPLLSFLEQLLDRFAFADISPSPGSLDMAGKLIRFVPLAIVNGAYIYSHNSLRGFTKSVKRANFWRSALTFPLAIGLSYLNPWGAAVPAVVINKLASDIIGGFTEVTFKIRRETKRAKAMYASLLPALATRPESKRERYLQRLAILDILYVWGDSPRGREALKKAIDAQAEREMIWEKMETPVRRYETYVKLITEKSAWRKPRRIKLEFLRLAAAFSYWLEKNRGPSGSQP